MASAAYQLPNVQREEEPRPRVRVVRGGRRKLDKIRSVLKTMRKVLVAGVLLGLVVSLVYSQAVINELTGEVESARNSLTAAQSNNDYLTASMDAFTSRANIEETAEEHLGLVKADNTQYTYILLENETLIAKNDTGVAKLFGGFRAAALNMLGDLNP